MRPVESDVLLSPGVDLATHTPDIVLPAVLHLVKVTDDLVLGSKGLDARHAIFVVLINLPVLVRVKVLEVVNRVCPLGI